MLLFPVLLPSVIIFTSRLFKGQGKLYTHIARKPNNETDYFPAVYYSIFKAHAFLTWPENAFEFFIHFSVDLFRRVCKNYLTLFHRQDLTLVNTLFLDSALGTQLPDIHLHLFYIKKC
jgi:hypothetical protein